MELELKLPPETKKDNFLWFLGTAGARFSMIFQLRSTGGIWVRIGGFNILVDPGPGSLVRVNEFLPELDPLELDAVILTHRHLDHSGDMNAITEAMTYGGRIRKGTVILPVDATEPEEPVLLRQFYHKVQKIVTWEKDSNIQLSESIILRPVELRHHGVQCFGFKIYSPDIPVTGFMADTAFDPVFVEQFSDCSRLIVNVTLLKRISRIDHISVPEVSDIMELVRPDTIIMTHLGTSLIENDPDTAALSLKSDQTDVIAARDSMVFDIRSGIVIIKGKSDNRERIELVKQKLSYGKTLKDHRR